MHSQLQKLVMNLNVDYQKLIHLYLDFAKSMNSNFQNMKGSNSVSNTTEGAGLLVH